MVSSLNWGLVLGTLKKKGRLIIRTPKGPSYREITIEKIYTPKLAFKGFLGT